MPRRTRASNGCLGLVLFHGDGTRETATGRRAGPAHDPAGRRNESCQAHPDRQPLLREREGIGSEAGPLLSAPSGDQDAQALAGPGVADQMPQGHVSGAVCDTRSNRSEEAASRYGAGQSGAHGLQGEDGRRGRLAQARLGRAGHTVRRGSAGSTRMDGRRRKRVSMRIGGRSEDGEKRTGRLRRSD